MLHMRLDIAVIGFCALALQVSAGSEKSISWLRGKCPEGAAMIHQYGGSGYSSESDLYLYEVATGSRTKIGRGCQPEFSPDGNLIAWIEGSSAKGCSRKNTGQKHTIATGISKNAGVHWVSNTEVIVVINSKWYRVDVGTGNKTEVPTLKRLGTGGTEIDVKYRGSDNWSYVAGTTWKY
ncbi:MAG: hypothetical protein GF331_23270, partial [Chitinivibrionales bacterium]|nr:hypothetical protein [Chitinivibrionales bacterium]